METDLRLLPLREVLALTGVSKPTLYRMIASGRAPRPVRASPGRSGWVAREVEAMIEGRIAERDTAIAASAQRARRRERTILSAAAA